MKTAIIGLGPHGKRLYQAVQRIEKLKLGALVDANPNAMESLSAENKFSSVEEMLSAYEPELVIISTNGPSHFPIAELCISKGAKNLLISKPVTCKLNDAIRLFELSKTKQVKIAVDHGLRYDITYNWIKQQIASGTWGSLFQIHITRNRIGLGCLGTHSFDLANFLFDKKPVKVTGWVDKPVMKNPRGEQFVDPGGLAILEYGNEQKAIISQIEMALGPAVVQLFFEKSRITIDEKFGTYEVVEFESAATPEAGKSNNFVKTLNPNGKLEHDMVDLMERLLLNLINDPVIKADITNGLSAVEILVAVYQSHQMGNSQVDLPVTNQEYLNLFLPVT